LLAALNLIQVTYTLPTNRGGSFGLRLTHILVEHRGSVKVDFEVSTTMATQRAWVLGYGIVVCDADAH